MAAATSGCAILTKLRQTLLKSPNITTIKHYCTRAELVEKYNLRRRSNTIKNYKYITDSRIATTIASKLDVRGKVVIETSPGPGLLTKELIKQKPRKIIGLEPEKKFLPRLKELENTLFEARFADFAKVDPHLVPDGKTTQSRVCKEPAISSKDFFNGLNAASWHSDEIPVMFVGIEGGQTVASTTKVLISYLARIPTRESVFEMGRCQLAFFYTEDRLERLLARPGSRYYNRLSIMAAIFCDIDIIHTEPCSSFDPYFRKDSKKSLTLVTITPKKNCGVNVPEHSLSFIGYFIRLLMIKPKQPLVTALEGISPGAHEIVEHLGWGTEVRACDLIPEQFGELISEFFHWGRNSHLDFFYSMGQKR